MCLSVSGMGPARPAVVRETSARSYPASFHRGFALRSVPSSPEAVGMSRPSKTTGLVSLSRIRPWHKSPGDGSLLGRRVPHQTASCSSQILEQTRSRGDRHPFLLFKQQPHDEIPPIKSRPRFSRQRDKNPFGTCNFLSYLGLLQSKKQLQIDGITVCLYKLFCCFFTAEINPFVLSDKNVQEKPVLNTNSTPDYFLK